MKSNDITTPAWYALRERSSDTAKPVFIADSGRFESARAVVGTNGRMLRSTGEKFRAGGGLYDRTIGLLLAVPLPATRPQFVAWALGGEKPACVEEVERVTAWAARRLIETGPMDEVVVNKVVKEAGARLYLAQPRMIHGLWAEVAVQEDKAERARVERQQAEDRKRERNGSRLAQTREWAHALGLPEVSSPDTWRADAWTSVTMAAEDYRRLVAEVRFLRDRADREASRPVFDEDVTTVVDYS